MDKVNQVACSRCKEKVFDVGCSHLISWMSLLDFDKDRVGCDLIRRDASVTQE